MKVTVHANVDIETDVNISVEDITAALCDIEHETNETIAHPNANERNKAFAIGQFVTAAWQCISAVSDEMIDMLSPQSRSVIADALNTQAARFRK